MSFSRLGPSAFPGSLAQGEDAVLRRPRRKRERTGERGGVLDTDLDELTRFIGLREAVGERDAGQIRKSPGTRLQNRDDLAGVQAAAPRRARGGCRRPGRALSAGSRARRVVCPFGSSRTGRIYHALTGSTPPHNEVNAKGGGFVKGLTINAREDHQIMTSRQIVAGLLALSMLAGTPAPAWRAPDAQAAPAEPAAPPATGDAPAQTEATEVIPPRISYITGQVS